MKDNESYEEWRDRWALEVGRFVLAFGSIEGATHRALQSLPRDRIGDSVKLLTLSQRLEILIAVVSGHDGPKWKALGEQLKQAKGLLTKRNAVAHNGLGVLIEFDNEGNEKQMWDAILSERRSGKHILFDEMVRHRELAESIAREITFVSLGNLDE